MFAFLLAYSSRKALWRFEQPAALDARATFDGQPHATRAYITWAVITASCAGCGARTGSDEPMALRAESSTGGLPALSSGGAPSTGGVAPTGGAATTGGLAAAGGATMFLLPGAGNCAECPPFLVTTNNAAICESSDASACACTYEMRQPCGNHSGCYYGSYEGLSCESGKWTHASSAAGHACFAPDSTPDNLLFCPP